jgi:hypothetical protein
VAPLGRRNDAHTQERARHRDTQGGRKHEGVAQHALADEQGGGTVGLGLSSGLTEPGHVVSLEEPSFHGDAD